MPTKKLKKEVIEVPEDLEKVSESQEELKIESGSITLLSPTKVVENSCVSGLLDTAQLHGKARAVLFFYTEKETSASLILTQGNLVPDPDKPEEEVSFVDRPFGNYSIPVIKESMVVEFNLHLDQMKDRFLNATIECKDEVYVAIQLIARKKFGA